MILVSTPRGLRHGEMVALTFSKTISDSRFETADALVTADAYAARFPLIGKGSSDSVLRVSETRTQLEQRGL